ncbi:MAG TPA: polyprenyl synthetase family protein [Thermomicrobiaceae bacterium]|nr:polyprenyl synthetase family protein [Thermomicrobiaceae bacterium]
MAPDQEERYLALIEESMRAALHEQERATADLFAAGDLPLYQVLRYHLGWADTDFAPAECDPGKRTRPLVCLHAAAAVGGDVQQVAPIAAGIELLHNFTLIHDDIQDESASRRHRATVWAQWGAAQAINAGDAMFALGQLAVLAAAERGVPLERILRVQRGFNETTLRIVEGQVLDLGFECRWDLERDDYLRMIGGKTAAIVAFAAWAGACSSGASDEQSERFRAFGRALGLGFQVRDDLLGIWGSAALTGKPVADDIRRRKKSLPMLLLASEADQRDLAELRAIYTAPAVDAEGVRRVLALLARYEIEEQVQSEVDRLHQEAAVLLEAAAPPSPARAALSALLERLATRVG